jgi:hypothetical protein
MCPAGAQQEQQQQLLSCTYLFVKIPGRRIDSLLLAALLSHLRESVTVMLAMQRQGTEERLHPARAQQEQQEQRVLSFSYLFIKMPAGRREDDVLPSLSHMRTEIITVTLALAMQGQGTVRGETLYPTRVQDGQDEEQFISLNSPAMRR